MYVFLSDESLTIAISNYDKFKFIVYCAWANQRVQLTMKCHKVVMAPLWLGIGNYSYRTVAYTIIYVLYQFVYMANVFKIKLHFNISQSTHRLAVNYYLEISYNLNFLLNLP